MPRKKPAEPEQTYVRLYPYMPGKGFVVQRYNYGGCLFVGGEYPRWYVVTPAMANALATKRQNSEDPDSRPLFQVVSETERARIDVEEEALRLAAVGVHTRATPVALPNPKGAPVDYSKNAPRAAALPPGAGDVLTSGFGPAARGTAPAGGEAA